MDLPLDRRPLIVAVAGPNGAGKTTFCRFYLKDAALPFINPDRVAHDFKLDPYKAADLAAKMRRTMVEERESFAFETVFSDPVGDKLGFLTEAADSGYNVVLCFIGISSPEVSEQRVAMRVTQGGHDVPADKLISRFPRTLANLKQAIQTLPRVWIFDNDNTGKPFRLVAVYENGAMTVRNEPVPAWLAPLLP